MKYQLIMLPNQPILVSDEDIKDNEKFISFEKNLWGEKYSIHTLTKELSNKCVVDEIWNVQANMKWLRESNGYKASKIIAGIPELPKIDFSGLSPKEHAAIEYVDVVNLAIKNGCDIKDISGYSFIKGFKTAQSLNEKKFSLEDIKPLQKLVDEGYDPYDTSHHLQVQRMLKTIEDFINSLSQPKVFDVEIQMDRVRYPKEDDGWEDVYTPKITDNTIRVTKILP